jgi:ferredoxin-NADP reductase
MLLPDQTAVVTNILQETHNTRRFFLEVKDAAAIDFKPGQFITLDLPIHEKKNKRLKSYSIASAPSGDNKLELVIVLLPGGLGTEYLFNQVQVGTELTFKGPQGHFTLSENIPQNLFLICTGTGIAPFRSMVQELANKKMLTQNISIIFGTRQQSDLLYAQELFDLQKQYPNFNYIPVLSREKWEGKMGYVHAVYQELAANKPDAEFMLCGWRAMIDEARTTLASMGYSKEKVHFELYG